MKHSWSVLLNRLVIVLFAVILLVPPAALPFSDPLPQAFAQTPLPPDYLLTFGSEGSSDGQFKDDGPWGAAVDASGNVWISDYKDERFQKFNSSGTFQDDFGGEGTDDDEFTGNGPRDIAIDSEGNIWVTDTKDHKIKKFNSSGVFITSVGDGSKGTSNIEFNEPSGIDVDSADNVWVADTKNEKVKVYDKDGGFLFSFGSSGTGNGQFKNDRLYGIAMDSSDNVYTIEEDKDGDGARVQKFDSSGTFLLKWGSEGTTDGQFKDPRAIGIDNHDNVWVVDTNNERLQAFDSSGTFLTKYQPGSGSGTGKFTNNGPHGIAFDPNSDVFYVTDTENNRVLKFQNNLVASVVLPGTPVGLSAVAGDTEVALSWDTPSDGGAVDDYEVKSRIINTGSWAVLGNVPGTSANVTGLANNTEYEFEVSASNSAGNGTAASTTATPAPLGDPWCDVTGCDDFWSFRQMVTIDNSKVSGNSDLANFPVLVSVTDVNLKSSNVQSEGQDIRFTNQDGTQLYSHEVESFVNDASSGTLTAWVNMPSLSATSDTILYMYYGNSSTTSASTSDTWNSNYQLVQHLNDDFLDSTSNNHDGTNQGSTDTPGQMGNAQDFDGTVQKIQIPQSTVEDLFPEFTLSVWINPDGVTNDNSIYTDDFANNGIAGSFIGFGTNDGWILRQKVLDATAIQFWGGFGNSIDGATGTLSANTWQQVAVTFDGTNYKLYHNGAQSGITTTGTAPPNNNHDMYIGGIGNTNPAFSFDGQIDEVQISNVALSEDWIATEYNNQNSPVTFYTIGAQESGTGNPVVTVPGIPTNLSAVAGDTEVTLSWTAPNSGGAIITDYVIERNDGSGWATFTDGTSSATTATVTGLTNGTSYDFRVSATNSVGTGTVSTTASATPVESTSPYEVGTVSTNGWTSVSIQGSYTNPVVIAQPIDGYETSAVMEYATAVVKDVTSSSFQVQLYRGDNTGGAIAGNVGYIVVESGDHTLDNGVHMQAGSLSISQYDANGTSGGAWQTINFPSTFSSAPTFVATPNKDSAQDWVTARYNSNINNTRVVASLEIDGSHGTGPKAASSIGDGTNNTMAWLAIDRGVVTGMEGGLKTGVNENPGNGNWESLSFSNTYSDPIFLSITNQQGSDPTVVGRNNLSSTGVDFRLTEETDSDAEQNHANAHALWMVFDTTITEVSTPVNL